MVIDLYPQRDAICAYTQGWSKAAIVAWLLLYGDVRAFRERKFFPVIATTLPVLLDNLPFDDVDFYVFVPSITEHPLFYKKFRFNDNDEFEVLRY